MSLPKQVQKQVAEIDELEKQLYAVEPSTKSEDEVAEPLTPEAEQTEESVEAKAEAPVKEDKADKEPESDDPKWKQKYKTLQGMYDAEVPRLHQQVKDLNTQLEELKKTVESANDKAAEAKQEAEYERLKNLVTDEERQEFGDDLIEVQRKVAREETAELVKQLEAIKSENAKLHELLQQTDSQVSHTSFQHRLTQLVPDFEQVNSDPAWIAWLDENDPLLRAPRRVVAERAYAEGDAESVAHFVNLFRESSGQSTTDTKKKVVKQELEAQIQPSKSASSNTPVAPAGKTYTNDQVRNMFLRVTQLNKTGKLDEARKLEAEIDAAYMQGRVSG